MQENDFLTQRTTTKRYQKQLQKIYFVKEKYSCCLVNDLTKLQNADDLWKLLLKKIKQMANAPLPIPGDHDSAYFLQYQTLHESILKTMNMIDRSLVGNVLPDELHGLLNESIAFEDLDYLYETSLGSNTDNSIDKGSKKIDSIWLYSRCTIPPLGRIKLSL